MSDYERIIGLEIHAEVATKSKIFCSCSTKFGQPANENTCPICIGMPGTLPMLNEEVVALAIKAGKALNCNINSISKFDRKNYFYPDLPKGYQITQMDMPICSNGYYDIEVDGEKRRIHINRIHIEEDAGKLIHMEKEDISLVDYNRAGVPLIEIVTEADFRSPEEVTIFLRDLRAILLYTGVSDGKMEEGSLRCDVNISLRKSGTTKLNKRVEIKNLNSFKEVYRALIAEEKRQNKLYMQGRQEEIQEETRRWDEKLEKTILMRSKEETQDYRYFPDTDLMTVVIDEDFIEEISKNMAELPNERKNRIIEESNIKESQLDILMEDKAYIDYFEETISYGVNPEDAANWITIDILRILKEKEITGKDIPIKPLYLARLIGLIDKGTISRNLARKVLYAMIDSDKTPEILVEEMGFGQISDIDELEGIVSTIIEDNPEAVEDYKNGKSKAIGYMMGEIMKATRGKANPPKVKEILQKKLQKIH